MPTAWAPGMSGRVDTMGIGSGVQQGQRAGPMFTSASTIHANLTWPAQQQHYHHDEADHPQENRSSA